LSFFTRSRNLSPPPGGTTAEDDPTASGGPQHRPAGAGENGHGGTAKEAGDQSRRNEGRGSVTGKPGNGEGTQDRGRRRRLVAARIVTGLAGLFVLFALIAPTRISPLQPGAYVHLPVEGLLGAALVLLLQGRARRVAAVVLGAALGLLAIVKIVGLGFFVVLDRPFDPLLHWSHFENAGDYLTESMTPQAATGLAAAAAVLAVTVLVLMTRSVLRLTRIMARHRRAATGGVAVLGVVWVACATLGAQIVPGVPVATHAYDRPLQVRAGLQDPKAFAAEATADPYRDTPGKAMLTGLRGKDVVLAFVESYGRGAVEDPKLAPPIDALLDDGTRRLRAAGYTARSAFLTSPTFGGVSWLAHATLQSGMWIDNPRGYDNLLTSQRTTLTSAFKRASWRTVAVMPGTTKPWPEGAAFYRYDRVYIGSDLGYRGPRFSWSPMPDQYALSAFQRAERAKRDRPPVMAEIPLTSSHSPWAPVPRLIDWSDLGDGSGQTFDDMATSGPQSDVVWRSPARVRAAYLRSIEYSLRTLISYVEEYGDKNLVFVFLGDHQPYSIVSGVGAGHDVPVTIVARDPAVLDKISGWGWHDGLNPGPQAPTWPMHAFRDRFLGAFGSQPGPAPASAASPGPSSAPSSPLPTPKTR
jgi:hypothetical protein